MFLYLAFILTYKIKFDSSLFKIVNKLKNILIISYISKMGAGDSYDHFCQDAAEAYWVFKAQEYLQSRNLNISSVLERKTDFEDYLTSHNPFPDGVNPEEKFMESCYAKNVDSSFKIFIDNLISRYPNCAFDITDVEKEYRNLSLKGDFTVTIRKLTDEKVIPFSLKNYGCDPGSIQLCSGTWHSIINNLVLEEAPGPGNYICQTTNKKFSAQRCKKRRNDNYIKLGLEDIIPCLEEIDNILNEVKEKYVKDPSTNMWTPEVSEQWRNDCIKYGNIGIDIVLKALNIIPQEKVKQWFLKKTDLQNKEELLILGGIQPICSLFNEKYKQLIVRSNSETSVVQFIHHQKNLRMSIKDDNGEILKIDIPFTLQKNGGWFLPKEKYEGSIYHKKEKRDLMYGQRRPKKSKEINTSTNMWFRIKDYI